MSTDKLNKVDLMILYELDRNYRTSYSAIAKKVHLSKQAVQKRIKNLFSRKIITQVITVVNTANFGFIPIQIFISLNPSYKERKEEFINYLISCSDVPQVALCEGTYELFFGIAAPSQAEIDEVLTNINKRFPNLIGARMIVQFIDTRLFTREYLVDAKREILPLDKGFHHRQTAHLEIKELDQKILYYLAKEPRSSFVDLALKLDTSAQTIKNRIKYLEKVDIIRGYLLFLNEDIFIQHNLLLKVNSLSPELEQQLFQYFALNPHVLFVVKALGEYDFVITMESKDFKEYRDFLGEFRNTFSSSIKDLTPLLVNKFLKLNFLPKTI